MKRLSISKGKRAVDVQPLIDIAIKHQEAHPKDAIKLLEVAQQLSPDDPLIEHKLKQLR